MKCGVIIAVFLGLASAAPAPQILGKLGGGKGISGASTVNEIGGGKPVPLSSSMTSTIAALRDRNGELDGGVGPKVRNEVLDSSPCGKIIFIFARASMEPSNMVSNGETSCL